MNTSIVNKKHVTIKTLFFAIILFFTLIGLSGQLAFAVQEPDAPEGETTPEITEGELEVDDSGSASGENPTPPNPDGSNPSEGTGSTSSGKPSTNNSSSNQNTSGNQSSSSNNRTHSSSNTSRPSSSTSSSYEMSSQGQNPVTSVEEAEEQNIPVETYEEPEVDTTDPNEIEVSLQGDGLQEHNLEAIANDANDGSDVLTFDPENADQNRTLTSNKLLVIGIAVIAALILLFIGLFIYLKKQKEPEVLISESPFTDFSNENFSLDELDLDKPTTYWDDAETGQTDELTPIDADDLQHLQPTTHDLDKTQLIDDSELGETGGIPRV